MVKREFTAVYKKTDQNYLAWVEEISGVNTQGKTKKEAESNLKDALRLIVKANRSISRKNLGILQKDKMKRESICVAIPA